MSVRRPRPRPKRSVSIPSLIAVVVADVLVGLMLVLIMPWTSIHPPSGKGNSANFAYSRVAEGRAKPSPVASSA
jgi:hypothetical protein